MSDHASWSLYLGRWHGIHVRLHMFFLLFSAVALFLVWRAQPPNASVGWSGIAVGSLGLLLLSVLLHEISHTVVAMRQGGYVDEIVLGPLGGLADCEGLVEPRAELAACLAGPAANLAICCLCFPILYVLEVSPWGLLSPLAPNDLIDESGGGVMGVKLVFWINWVLVVVNLWPAFPFDGGRALRAGLLVRWPQIGRRGASLIVASLAKVTAWSICLAAVIVAFPDDENLLPTRFALVLLAIFLFFSAKHEEQLAIGELEAEAEAEAEAIGRALARTFAPAAADPHEAAPVGPGPFTRWLAQRRERKLQQERERAADDERRVDEILTRLHEQGIASLSAEDRALLERVSVRYRNRQQS